MENLQNPKQMEPEVCWQLIKYKFSGKFELIGVRIEGDIIHVNESLRTIKVVNSIYSIYFTRQIATKRK